MSEETTEYSVGEPYNVRARSYQELLEKINNPPTGDTRAKFGWYWTRFKRWLRRTLNGETGEEYIQRLYPKVTIHVHLPPVRPLGVQPHQVDLLSALDHPEELAWKYRSPAAKALRLRCKPIQSIVRAPRFSGAKLYSHNREQ